MNKCGVFNLATQGMTVRELPIRCDRRDFDVPTQGMTVRELLIRCDRRDFDVPFLKKPNNRQCREIRHFYPPLCVESAHQIPPHYPPFAVASCKLSVNLTKDQVDKFFDDQLHRWFDYTFEYGSSHMPKAVMKRSATRRQNWPTKPHPVKLQRSSAALDKAMHSSTQHCRREPPPCWRTGHKNTARAWGNTPTNRQGKRQMLLSFQ